MQYVSTHVIPEASGVRLVAAGYQGKDHYGLKDIVRTFLPLTPLRPYLLHHN
jgi:hypothetical protein